MSEQALQYQVANFETILKAIHVMSYAKDMTDPTDVLARIHALSSDEELDGIVSRSYETRVSQPESGTDTH